MSEEEVIEDSPNIIVEFIFFVIWIVWLIIDLIIKIVKNLCCFCTLCVSGTLLALLIFGILGYGLSTHSQDYLNGVSSGFDMLNSQLMIFASGFDICAPMLNKLFLLYNFVLKMIYAFLANIADALNLTISGQPIFAWAKSQLVINYHQRRILKETAFNDYIENTLHTHGYSSMKQLPAGFQAKIMTGALKASLMADQALPVVDPTIFCSLIDTLVNFILNILQIFNVFFVNIFGAIIDALIKAIKQSSGSPDLLFIILTFFKNLLLDEIPFGHCLGSPLDLVKCMCTPTNSGAITDVGVWLVGCMFESCDASVYGSGFEAIQYCIGLRDALNKLGILGDAVSFLLNLVTELDKSIDLLNKAINALTSLVNSLTNLINSKMLDTHHMQGRMQTMESHAALNYTLVHHYQNILSTAFKGINNPYSDGHHRPSFPRENRTITADEDSDEVKNSIILRYLKGKDMADPVNIALLQLYNYTVAHAAAMPFIARFTNFTFHSFSKPFEMLMRGNFDMSLEEVMEEIGSIDFVDGITAYHDITLHVDEFINDHSIGNCYNGCPNCTEAKLAVCNKTLAYSDYLEAVANKTKSFIRLSKSELHLALQNATSEQRRAEIAKGSLFIKQQLDQYTSLKSANNIHKSGIEIVFQMFGQLSLVAFAGGAFVALTCTSCCGTCFGKSLNCCNAAISCCPMIMLLLATIISALMLNFATGSYSNNDLLSPFLQELGPHLLDMYNTNPSPQEILDQFTILNNLLGNMLNKLFIMVIQIETRIDVFGISLIRLPDAFDDDTILTWVESLILYPYFHRCITSADCIRNGLCYRIRDINNPNAYCTKECVEGDDCSDVFGYCIVAPFIQPGRCMSEIIPSFNVLLQPQCANITNIPVDKLDFTKGPVFQECPWCIGYFKSTEFWNLVLAVMKTGWEEGLFFFRLLNANQINMGPQGVFFGMLKNLPIAIPGFDAVQILTVATHFLVPPLQTVSYKTYDVVTYFSFEPFPTISSWWYFPNRDDNNPFGHATASMWTCEVLFAPPGIIGLFIIAALIVIIVTFIFAPFIWVLLKLLAIVVISAVGYSGKKTYHYFYPPPKISSTSF